MSDTLLLVAALAMAIAMGLAVRFTEPGGAQRTPIVALALRAMRGLRYHRAGKGRHAKPRQTSALTTIPDALTITARTA